MNTYDFIQKTLGLQGIKIDFYYVNNGTFHIYARSAHDFAICPICGKLTRKVHDKREQTYKHLDIWTLKTVIHLTKNRYVCGCDPEHPFDEKFEFVRRYQRHTIDYEKLIFMLTHKNTIQNVCDSFQISSGVCQRIYNYYATSVLEKKEPEDLRLLGIDDIARKKGHNYDTVIYNQETGSVVGLLTGRKKDDVVEYLLKLPLKIRKGIEAVSMDMSRSYCFAVLDCLPNAKPVVDRYHIAQNLHQRVDEARKHIQNRIRKYGNKNEVFDIRWALLKNVEDLSSKQSLSLILACNKYPEIERLHYLKEEFREFFELVTREQAAAFIDYYTKLAEGYDIPEVNEFCKTLNNWREYILNYYEYMISNGLVEGSNNKIKNIKRRAYGYRNSENFELRVKLEFACA